MSNAIKLAYGLNMGYVDALNISDDEEEYCEDADEIKNRVFNKIKEIQ